MVREFRTVHLFNYYTKTERSIVRCFLSAFNKFLLYPGVFLAIYLCYWSIYPDTSQSVVLLTKYLVWLGRGWTRDLPHSAENRTICNKENSKLHSIGIKNSHFTSTFSNPKHSFLDQITFNSHDIWAVPRENRHYGFFVMYRPRSACAVRAG